LGDPQGVARKKAQPCVEIPSGAPQSFLKGERTPLTINEVYCVEIKSEGDRYDDGPKRTARK
jgi:hypothetical protein